MAFKMKGFSGFGNSPIKKDIFKKKRAIKEVSEKAVESFFEGGSRLFGLRQTLSKVFKPKNNDKATKDKTKTTQQTNKTTKQDKIERQPERQPERNKRRDIIVTGP